MAANLIVTNNDSRLYFLGHANVSITHHHHCCSCRGNHVTSGTKNSGPCPNSTGNSLAVGKDTNNKVNQGPLITDGRNRNEMFFPKYHGCFGISKSNEDTITKLK